MKQIGLTILGKNSSLYNDDAGMLSHSSESKVVYRAALIFPGVYTFSRIELPAESLPGAIPNNRVGDLLQRR